MNTRILPCCFFLCVLAPAFGVAVGDTYDQVVAEKGAPAGKMEVGKVVLLTYPGQSIRVEDGKVASIKATSTALPATANKAIASPKPAMAAKALPVAPAELAWTDDASGARDLAKAKNRQTFLFFTGSDWCVWCKRLDQEILSTPEFKQYAAENLVLVKLDFPQKSVLPPTVVAQNEQLAKKYHVDGFPTVIVLDNSGRAVKRLGYHEGGPARFIAALEAQ